MTLSSAVTISKHRFFINQAISVNQCIEADKELSHYIINVLRLRQDAQVILFNNSDHEFVAQVTLASKKKIHLTILHSENSSHLESTLNLSLALSLIRSERFNWALQKATELGAYDIYPIVSDYTQIKVYKEKAEKRLSHWQKITVSACEQSGRIKVPQVHSPSALKEFLSQYSAKENVYIITLCPPRGGASQSTNSIYALDSAAKEKLLQTKIICLIGPEGGWSDEELSLFHTYNLPNFSLGNRILRSETAAITILSLLQSSLGDLK